MHDKNLFDYLLLTFYTCKQSLKHFFILLNVFFKVVWTVLSSLEDTGNESSAFLDFLQKLIRSFFRNKSIVYNLNNGRFVNWIGFDFWG